MHAVFQPPLVYLYHTLRYLAPRTPDDQERFPLVENLGVEVLATVRPWELDMPVLDQPTLGPGQGTPPSESPPVSLRGLSRATVTAQCKYGEKATRGIRIQVLRSEDGGQWKAAEVFENESRAGQTVRTTYPLHLDSKFVRIVVENRDPSVGVMNLTVAAKLGASD